MQAALASTVALLLAAGALAQNASDMLLAEYQKQRETELFEAGKRHYKLSWSIRDTGLIQQSTWQALRAVEVSEGKNPTAATWLGIVRNYGELFWRKRKKVASRESLLQYERNAAALERENVEAHVKLAKLAQKAKLNGRMTEHWLAALQYGAKLVVNDKGASIEGVPVPGDFGKWLQEQTATVNGGATRFEPAGAKAPRVDGVTEVGNGQVVVRTDLPGDAAAKLHALALALWPQLQQRLGGAPVRPLGLFVFSKRADYEAYLRACGHEGALGGSGLCDYGTFQTLVCAEGRDESDVQALVLHELAHLFFFGSSPVAMPDWYAEGFAESFGGQGTFQWEGKRLTLGAAMRRHRVEAMKAQPLPLRELLAARAEQLLAADHERAMRFYAQAWAFQRWLLGDDNPWRERFVAWEAECRGAMPGAQSTARFGDKGPAAAAFERTFGKELDAIDTAFRAWLATQ